MKHLVLLLLAACKTQTQPADPPEPAPPVASEALTVPPVSTLGVPLPLPDLRPPPPPPPTIDTTPKVCTPAVGSCPALAVTPDAQITLRRTACFGKCPEYEVAIHADGSVTWNGERNVAKRGAAAAKVDPKKARALFDLATSACFFDMKDRYRLGVTDNPSAVLTLTIGGRTWEIDVNPGDKASWSPTKCMPSDALFDLADRIDSIATRWK